jgi:hypothetical protein
VLSAAVSARAQASPQAAGQPAPPPPPRWTFQIDVSTYIFPDDDELVQPTVAADRGALHLEARYADEDRRAFAAFLGRNFTFGKAVTLAVTPMAGVLIGRTDAVIPAYALTLGYCRLELYSEGDYVITIDDIKNRFLTNWTELSVSATDWLRLGFAAQRTRTFEQPRDVQRGVFAGIAFGRFDGAVYWFNPEDGAGYVIVSVGVTLGG